MLGEGATFPRSAVTLPCPCRTRPSRNSMDSKPRNAFYTFRIGAVKSLGWMSFVGAPNSASAENSFCALDSTGSTHEVQILRVAWFRMYHHRVASHDQVTVAGRVQIS